MNLPSCEMLEIQFNFLQVMLTVGDKGVKMKVLFDRMVQKNTATGWERRLRLAVKPLEEDSGISCSHVPLRSQFWWQHI